MAESWEWLVVRVWAGWWGLALREALAMLYYGAPLHWPLGGGGPRALWWGELTQASLSGAPLCSTQGPADDDDSEISELEMAQPDLPPHLLVDGGQPVIVLPIVFFDTTQDSLTLRNATDLPLSLRTEWSPLDPHGTGADGDRPAERRERCGIRGQVVKAAEVTLSRPHLGPAEETVLTLKLPDIDNLYLIMSYKFLEPLVLEVYSRGPDDSLGKAVEQVLELEVLVTLRPRVSDSAVFHFSPLRRPYSPRAVFHVTCAPKWRDGCWLRFPEEETGRVCLATPGRIHVVDRDAEVRLRLAFRLRRALLAEDVEGLDRVEQRGRQSRRLLQGPVCQVVDAEWADLAAVRRAGAARRLVEELGGRAFAHPPREATIHDVPTTFHVSDSAALELSPPGCLSLGLQAGASARLGLRNGAECALVWGVLETAGLAESGLVVEPREGLLEAGAQAEVSVSRSGGGGGGPAQLLGFRMAYAPGAEEAEVLPECLGDFLRQEEAKPGHVAFSALAVLPA